MALVSPGVVGQISGRLGGSEFAVAGGRSVLKHAKTRRSKSSPAKMRAQNSQERAIARWHDLTDAERLAWKIAAEIRPRPDRFGNMRNLNAFQLFLTIPHDFLYTEFLNWQDVPPILNTPIPSSVSITIGSDGTFDIGASSWYLGGDCGEWVFFSRFRGPAQNGRAYTWRKLGMVDADAANITYIPVLVTENIEFYTDERVAIRVGFWQQGRWPKVIDYGVTTVVAP